MHSGILLRGIFSAFLFGINSGIFISQKLTLDLPGIWHSCWRLRAGGAHCDLEEREKKTNCSNSVEFTEAVKKIECLT